MAQRRAAGRRWRRGARPADGGAAGAADPMVVQRRAADPMVARWARPADGGAAGAADPMVVQRGAVECGPAAGRRAS
jgi:hypothetical protein